MHAQATQELARKSALVARCDTSAQELHKARAAEVRGLAEIAVGAASCAEAERATMVDKRVLADAG